MNPSVLDKFLERIDRLGPEEIQSYVQRLARERSFFQTIFDAIHEGVIVTDPDGRISFANPAACGLFGIERDRCADMLLADCIPGLDWKSLAQSEHVVTRDMEIFYPQNRRINFYTVPLRGKDEGGGVKGETTSGVAGYAMIVRDITESVRTTEKEIESEKISAVTLLAAGVAHEIGNPLNSLNIHLQLMERKARKLPAKQSGDFEASLRIAREEIQRLDHIITQFLRALRPARIEARLENINTLVAESVAFLEPEIKDRDIIVETELRDDLPRMEVDRDQIKQAFYNVIKNSLQAMKPRGILRIKTDVDDEQVSVTFADTGGGIAPENMNRVFEPYFTTKETGSGLGLLIVRRIVRAHGGEMEIVNDEGRGIRLSIRLPLQHRRVRMLPSSSNR
jgi:two-component system, sporulation sensor kinase E